MSKFTVTRENTVTICTNAGCIKLSEFHAQLALEHLKNLSQTLQTSDDPFSLLADKQAVFTLETDSFDSELGSLDLCWEDLADFCMEMQIALSK